MDDMIEDKTQLQDKQLVCCDCGKDFIWATGEQAYFWSKGLSEPKRCKACRMLRKRSIVTEMELQQLKGVNV